MSIERLSAALSDRYRIERELGQGGMATVYLAQDIKHDRKVALKVLKPELAAVIGAERFVVEIKTTAALQHPHILPLFDSGTAYGPDKSGPYLYYVMPFIDGETLRAKLDRETQLAVPEAVKLTIAVADALDYAHRHGVIHRDIKPENILLHDGRPMVADFGIALALSAAAGGRMTETGMSLGTPHYMSPEQATAEKEITGRSDIYSLGSVLYEMLAGQPPHLGGSAQQIIMKIIAEPVQMVTAYRKSVPANVAAAVAKSLEKLPADRFESAKAFAEALQDPAFTVAGTAAGTSLIAAGRSARLLPALSIVAVGALILAAWGWLRPATSPAASAAWQTDIPLGESHFQGSAALSPDGSFLIYGAAQQGKTELWLRRSGAVEPVPIAGTEGGGMPAISADGKRVAFLSANWQLMVVPVEGGGATSAGTTAPNFWDRISWIDDTHLLFSSYAGLLSYPTTGGAPVQLTQVDSAAGEGLHGFADALPDHQGFLFSIWPKGDFDRNTIQIAVAGPNGGKPRVLLPGLQAIYAVPRHLIVLHADGGLVSVPFDPATLELTGPETPLGLSVGVVSANAPLGLPTVARDGRLAWSTAGAGQRSDLVRVTRTGAIVSVDSSWPGSPIFVNSSADGAQIAAVVITGGGDVWDVQVQQVRTKAMLRLSTPGVWDEGPVFSHDGKSLVFVGRSTQGDVIYRALLGTTAAPELLIEGDAGGLSSAALSPDGQTLYYGRQGDIMARPPSPGGDSGRRLVATPAMEGEPAPSPDGRWLAYDSDESGRVELWVRSTDPTRAERWQISRAGVPRETSRWSHDGKELYYIAHDSLIAARTTSGATFTVTGQQALFSITPFMNIGGFAPLPTGDFIFTRPRQTGTAYRLMMVDDWKTMGAAH